MVFLHLEVRKLLLIKTMNHVIYECFEYVLITFPFSMFKLSMEGSVKEGILTITGGPNFESIAELKLFQMAGADALGRHFFLSYPVPSIRE